jgi:hypothetical protein
MNHRLEEILTKKITVAEEVLVNCYNFNQCCGSETKISDPVSDPA